MLNLQVGFVTYKSGKGITRTRPKPALVMLIFHAITHNSSTRRRCGNSRQTSNLQLGRGFDKQVHNNHERAH
uniref:Uncharacterized protein n=1 Tax=Physcomitrium patens TaxID=3218 RepID=A0A2K1JX87_PHYPA|nr:hypothetical protein PHYPA_013259 [Physcomitrium patens]